MSREMFPKQTRCVASFSETAPKKHEFSGCNSGILTSFANAILNAFHDTGENLRWVRAIGRNVEVLILGLLEKSVIKSMPNESSGACRQIFTFVLILGVSPTGVSPTGVYQESQFRGRRCLYFS